MKHGSVVVRCEICGNPINNSNPGREFLASGGYKKKEGIMVKAGYVSGTCFKCVPQK